MAINLDDIATKVMKLMQGSGHQMKMFDATSGKSVAIPAEARYFYVKEPNMMVNIDDSTQELKFHIGEDVDIDKPGINNMMKQLKSLARTNMLDFDIRSFGKHIKPKNYAYKVEQNKEQTMTDHVNEGMGPLSGSSRTSRQTLENVRLILKHRAPVNEESRGSRSRNISAMFIETAEGERFKYPFIHLNGARAMARHVASGGVPHDIVGEAIVELSSNLAQLKEFTKIVDKQQLVNENNRNVVFNVRRSMNSIKETVQRIQGARGYAKFVENIALKEDKVEAEISEETLDSYVQQFTKTSFEESLKDILPLVHRVNEEEMTDRRDNQTARVREIISARDKKTGEIVNTISFGEPTNPSYDYDKIKTQFAEPRSSEEVAQQKISKIALTFDDLADRVTVDTLLDRTTKKKGHDLAAEISFFLTDIANEIRSNPSGIDKEDMKVAGHLLKMSKASVETEEPKTADTRINEMLEEAFSKFDSDKVLIKEQNKIDEDDDRLSSDNNDFIEYVRSYYGKDEFRASEFINDDGSEGVSIEEIKKAIEMMANDDTWNWAGGDTDDRIEIADIMLRNRGIDPNAAASKHADAFRKKELARVDPIPKRKSDKEIIKKLRQDADDDIKARDKRDREEHPEWFDGSQDSGDEAAYARAEERLKKLAGMKEQKQELKEGTSGIMGMKNSQGNYDFIRVNWDAYPEGLGQTLKNSWNNPEEIERAISKGDASSIGNDIDDSVFYADKEGMNNNKPERNETEEDLHSIAMRMGAEYGYIFDNGKWTEVLHSEEAVSEDIYMENEYETIEWKNRFNKPYYIDEPCPDCGNEVQILSDASSDCPDCGHPEVLPCSECPRLEEQICDWNKWTRCSEFPKGEKNEYKRTS